MFDHLADPSPPAADAGVRAAVAERARRLARRRTLVRQAVVAGVALVALGSVAIVNRAEPNPEVTAGAPATACCPGVEGTVTDQVGAVGGVSVLLIDPDHPPAGAPEAGWRVVARAVTAPDGSFRVAGVPPGRYAVRFEDRFDDLAGKVRHHPVFLGGTDALAGARLVDVGSGPAVRADQRLELSPNHGIRGMVREQERTYPIRGVTVRLFAGGLLVRQTVTDDQGRYDLGGVRPGEYQVLFVDEASRPAGRYRRAWVGRDTPVTMPEDRDIEIDVVLAR